MTYSLADPVTPPLVTDCHTKRTPSLPLWRDVIIEWPLTFVNFDKYVNSATYLYTYELASDVLSPEFTLSSMSDCAAELTR